MPDPAILPVRTTVRTQTRHQLKQDRFATTASEAVSWTVEHRDKLTYAGIAVAVIVAIALGGWWYTQRQNEAGNIALGEALATYNAPLVAAGTPPSGQTKSFASNADRAKAAKDEFKNVADHYGRTAAGEMAKYFVGLCDVDLNNNADAERELKDVAGASNADVASLAKMALASLYRKEGKDQDAINLYKQLADKPTNSVSKPAAQLALADLYETKDPQNAKILYQQIQKENAQSPAAQIASERLATIKPQ